MEFKIESFIATGKSPCYTCEHRKRDKDSNDPMHPCSQCIDLGIPSDYDDRICGDEHFIKMPKRFTVIETPPRPVGLRLKKYAKWNKVAEKLGYINYKVAVRSLYTKKTPKAVIGRNVGMDPRTVANILKEDVWND